MRSTEANDNLRSKNPFLETLATELIEDPKVYKKYFSQRVLVGEALEVFRLMNVVVRGPQGSGKSMLLNLIKHQVVGQWLCEDASLPEGLQGVNPYVGLGINLQRINFHLFGRRSFSRSCNQEERRFVDAACAGDFLNHYIFLEFSKFVHRLGMPDYEPYRKWMEVEDISAVFVHESTKWDCWRGYYGNCRGIEELVQRIRLRLRAYTDYLNGNKDSLSELIARTKEDIGVPGHNIGKFLNMVAQGGGKVGFFTVIDQYEVLRELNPSHGDGLVRLVNTVMKRRDPYSFYKIGVRTHDWDIEKAVYGADARLELNRDYVDVSIDGIFRRRENTGGKFTEFIEDVAIRRIEAVMGPDARRKSFVQILGETNREREVSMFTKRLKAADVVQALPVQLRQNVLDSLKRGDSLIECQLAVSWVLQQLGKGIAIQEVQRELIRRHWLRESWRKERVDLAVFRLAVICRQQRVYFGKKTIVTLAGNNVTAFLLIAGKIWDMAAKRGVNMLYDDTVDERIQNKAIHAAAEEWCDHDRRVQSGGEYRSGMLAKMSELVLGILRNDEAMSNPGYTGISFAEVEIRNEGASQIAFRSLSKAVSWAMLEERRHKSKDKGREQYRLKYFFHPLVCVRYGVPIGRVKEPIYIRNLSEVMWIFDPSSSGAKGEPESIRSKRDGAQAEFDL